MGIKTNGYYADPALDESFDNLAKAFAGPTGADVANYATAAATQQKAARLASLFANPNDPNFDREAVAGGLYAPSSSYYAVNRTNDTAQRGQDMTAKSATDVANLNNAGELARTYAKPVILSEGQTATLPDQTQAATGMPATLSGAFKTDPGQTITKPDGSVISGITKPMTTDELKASILGQQSPAEQRAVVMEPAGVAQVTGKDGEPTNVFKADSVGQTPYEKETLQPQLGTYATATGKGAAVFDKDTKKWKDTQTGADLPAGVPVTSIAPGTQVNIDTKAGSKIEDAYGEGVGKQIQMTLDNDGAAPRNLAEIAQFRDALNRAGDNITTGPLGKYVLAAKQGIGGLLGEDFKGVPEAELINNIGFKLATQASKAISSRPTQFEFGQALATKPGLALSKPGMQATLSIMEQNAHDDQALAKLASDPANRANWTATVQKYYADNPVRSPFDPSKALGQADIDKLEAAAPNAGAAVAPAATTPAKPATVTQNGLTYDLQPDGSYK